MDPILHCKVRPAVVFYFKISADRSTVLKLLLAAMYTDFSTAIVDDEGIEQADALIAAPKSGKLIVQFRAMA